MCVIILTLHSQILASFKPLTMTGCQDWCNTFPRINYSQKQSTGTTNTEKEKA